MVTGVASDQVTGADERRDRSGVGGKATGKRQCRIDFQQPSECLLELLVCLRVAAHQGARPCAKTFRTGGLRGRLCQSDIAGVAEVVVGPEVCECLPIEIHLAALPAGPDSRRPLQTRGAEGKHVGGDPGERAWQRRAAARLLVESRHGRNAAGHADSCFALVRLFGGRAGAQVLQPCETRPP